MPQLQSLRRYQSWPLDTIESATERISRMRSVGRQNPDGRTSTVRLMDSGTEVIPSLYPLTDPPTADPKDWKDYGWDWEGAYSEAQGRDEVLKFRTPDEAQRVAKGAWKQGRGENPHDLAIDMPQHGPPYQNEDLLRRRIFPFPELSDPDEITSAPPIYGEGAPSIAAPPPELSDTQPPPPLEDPSRAAYEAIDSGELFPSQKPERRSKLLQGLGYAASFVKPLSRTDLPERLIFKEPLIDPAIRQAQREEGGRSGRATDLRRSRAATLKQDEAELAESTKARKQRKGIEDERIKVTREGIKSRGDTAALTQQNTLLSGKWVQLGPESLVNGKPNPDLYEGIMFTTAGGENWGRVLGSKKPPPIREVDGVIIERQPGGGWVEVYKSTKTFDAATDIPFQRAKALLGIKAGSEIDGKVTELKAEKEKRMATISDKLASAITILKNKWYNLTINKVPFPADLTRTDLKPEESGLRSQFQELFKEMTLRAAQAKAQAAQTHADAMEALGVENTDPLIDYVEQDLSNPDIQLFLGPEEAEKRRAFIEAFERVVGEPPSEADLDAGRSQRWEIIE